ncbi:MAG: UDP-2,3-diacylglucosamine diphosphatase [Candidatus Thiodiazotropha sp.]
MQLFISDLHLCADRPETVQIFFRFLRQRAAQASHLYILGDLFEVWIGDDDEQAPIPEVIAALRELTDGGTWLGVMHGNRDFLLGERFCSDTGAELIDDPSLRLLQGIPTLLMHGDLLCTDDKDYLAFRRQVRDPGFQQQFLALPLEARREKARDYRAMSGEANALKGGAIMDVSPQTVNDALRRHGARQLIHGHTHRPGDHRIDRAMYWVIGAPKGPRYSA